MSFWQFAEEMLMRRFLRWLASRLQCREIHGEQGLYLSRYHIYGWMPGDTRSYPFGIYLHRFHTPDQDQTAPHSHPWKWAVSLILTGGYREERMRVTGEMATCELRAPALNRIAADDFHVVERLYGETCTLFITGPKASSWGFLVPGRGVIPWKQRLAERGLPE